MPVRIEVLDAPVEVASRSTTWARRRRETARALAPRTRPMDEAPEPSLAVATADQSTLGAYTVLVATLSDAARAEHLRSRIALKFDDAHVSPLDVGADRYYRVRIGPYPNRSVALARAALVNRYGYPAVITDEAHP
jgi:cell division septation protein DedD